MGCNSQEQEEVHRKWKEDPDLGGWSGNQGSIFQKSKPRNEQTRAEGIKELPDSLPILSQNSQQKNITLKIGSYGTYYEREITHPSAPLDIYRFSLNVFSLNREQLF